MFFRSRSSVPFVMWLFGLSLAFSLYEYVLIKDRYSVCFLHNCFEMIFHWKLMLEKLSVKCILCLRNIYVKKKRTTNTPPPPKKNDKANTSVNLCMQTWWTRESCTCAKSEDAILNNLPKRKTRKGFLNYSGICL